VFAGIVREKGKVVSAVAAEDGARLVVAAPRTAPDTAVGDSVAVDGVCLTAVSVTDGEIAFDAVAETLRRSSLGSLQTGHEVNVEPALRAGDPLGGHYVQGHVDAVGRVTTVEPEGDGRCVTFDAPPEVLRYCAEKGSITVDGVSLTVAGLDDTSFTVALIPHTLAETTLGALESGDEVNLEADVLAKYVERLLPRN
jgi:riboflavin synthase